MWESIKYYIGLPNYYTEQSIKTNAAIIIQRQWRHYIDTKDHSMAEFIDKYFDEKFEPVEPVPDCKFIEVNLGKPLDYLSFVT